MVKTNNFDDDGNLDVRNVLPTTSKRKSRSIYRNISSISGEAREDSPASVDFSRILDAVRVGTPPKRTPRTSKILSSAKKQRDLSAEPNSESEEDPFADDASSDDYVPEGNDDDDEELEPSDDDDESGKAKNDSDEESSDAADGKLDHILSAKKRKKKEDQTQHSVEMSSKTEKRRTPYCFSKKKVKMSGKTLEGLEMQQLDANFIAKEVSKMSISNTHPVEHAALTENLDIQFLQWLTYMRFGWNILLTGLGSKLPVLTKFKKLLGRKSNIVHFNGYLPQADVKLLLKAIIEGILEKVTPSALGAQLDLIRETFDSSAKEQKLTFDVDVFIIIHGLENCVKSSIARMETFRDVLLKLAPMKGIHILAAVDNVHYPALFTVSEQEALNFLTVKIHTFEPYLMETRWTGTGVSGSNKKSSRGGIKGSTAFAALEHLFCSLTRNTKKIFFLLARHQLERSSGGEEITFSEFYQMCRDEMLVTSDAALRNQLVEFVDHESICFVKRKSDGQEGLRIPLENSILEKFVETYDNDEI
ncbi:unnamed protein product [Notodromas monacha]|uniref:Origin recognition complex subunit 2 n=1 Tax=Notodromas monacha TaxID=399045 RepID=A0A7R9BJN1_9CRUS|nr:unnamed protein product [Notodromas monacha]CAG0915209.1 unnamed protein product [Notodromas monacha]